MRADRLGPAALPPPPSCPSLCLGPAALQPPLSCPSLSCCPTLHPLQRLHSLNQVEVDEGSMRETVETKESKSYPGLLSRVGLLPTLLV